MAWTLPIEGGCLCGTLRFRVTEPPLLAAACHCRGCQQMTGSAFSTTLIVPASGFERLAGEPVKGALRRADQHHWHCPECHGWVWSSFNGAPEIVNVRATQLDDPAPFRPLVETGTADKLPWASTGARHAFAGFPEPERYEPLVAEYRSV